MTVKGSPTNKISSSNLENPGASCFPSQISRRAAAQAGGEAHGRRWVWRRRGARSARRPRLRPRCELISNPRDRRARLGKPEWSSRVVARAFFRHLPPPHTNLTDPAPPRRAGHRARKASDQGKEEDRYRASSRRRGRGDRVRRRAPGGGRWRRGVRGVERRLPALQQA